MRLERLNNLPLNTITPKFVAIFVFFGTASSFTGIISFLEIQAKLEAILFLFGCSEVNSTWIITSGPANPRAKSTIHLCGIYESYVHFQNFNWATFIFLLMFFFFFFFFFCCLYICFVVVFFCTRRNLKQINQLSMTHNYFCLGER